MNVSAEVVFTCSACDAPRRVDADAVTLVVDRRPRIVTVCPTCGTTYDNEACDAMVALVRSYVRVVEIAEPELTPDAVLALVDQIRALPEAHR